MNKQILWFASTNYGKIKDIAFLLRDFDIKLISDLSFSYKEPEEDGLTFEQNAFIKAKALSEVVGTWVIGDDSGICVESLDNFPGINSKRWAYPETDAEKLCELLLNKMEDKDNKTNRNAFFQTSLVLYNSKTKQKYVFTGKCEGTIDDKIVKSDFTFAYDWIFKPKKFNIHFAELDSETKRNISARGKASKQLIEFLESDEFKYE